MEIRRERLNHCLSDVDALVTDYFERTNAQDGQPKLDMNWAELMRIDEMGKLAIFCAREDEKLRGFAMYVLMKHLHHATTMWALCDILAVDPDYRGQQIASRLIMHAERKFKHMGIDYMTHNYRVMYGVEPLFPKMGFTLTEHTYMKAL